jgi:protein-S-isoprenylcysteine O-methyltransferase Ste14
VSSSRIKQQPSAAVDTTRLPLAVRIGNFLFRYRNAVGPAVFLVALLVSSLSHPFGRRELDVLFVGAGVIVALAGEALRILTIGFEYIERGGRDRKVYASKLVTGGVFEHCRNPLYLGNLLICAGFSLVTHSWAFSLVVLPLTVLTYICIVAAEEDYLRAKFGDEYQHYCARVHRWWPRASGWRQSMEGMRFNWQRVVVKEYNTALLLLLCLIVLGLWSQYQTGGTGALPRQAHLVGAFLLWLLVYLLARWLKKSGTLRAE